MPKRRTSLLCRVLSAVLVALPALAGPTGEVVIEGQADFSRPDDQTTIIDTKTDTTIIEYDGFDILQGELVEIHQPTDQSKTLNHVPQGDPTKIAGKLWSNGFVYVVNPSGIFVGDTAVIDVGGLVAAAGRISYDEFMQGIDHFTDLGGEVVVADGALVRADDSVALLGQRVASYGTIVSEGGMVAFVAGNEAVLGSLDGHLAIRVDGGGAALPDDQFALVQGGTVDAGSGRVQLTAGDTYSLAMNHSGITRGREIRLEAQADGLVQVSGTLDASAKDAGGTGGRVEVLGDEVAVLDARIDASGDAGGGAIRIGGDFQGGPDLRAASRTAVSGEAELLADAITTGDGGSIIVWSEERTGFYGSASARGGAASGDGGFVEISGRQSLDARGHHVDLSAANGRSGTLLYDPRAIEIRGGVGDGPDFDAGMDPPGDPDLLEDGVVGQILSSDTGPNLEDPFVIYESEIEGTDANIILQASEEIFVLDAASAFSNIAGSEGMGEVVVMDGNSLVIQTTGEPPAGFTSSDYAIDLGSEVVWKVSGGGVIDIRTQAGDVADPGASTPANIRVGHLVFGGRAFVDVDGVMIAQDVVPDSSLGSLGVGLSVDASGDGVGVNLQTEVGSVVVGSIHAMGEDASNGGLTQASAGAPVRISTGAGDITVVGKADPDPMVEPVGIVTTGGSADPSSTSASRGGAGGSVSLEASEGSVFIDGSIDASGGDGLAGVVQVPGDDSLFSDGQGGRGGAVALSAFGTDLPTGRVEVRADVTSNGGEAKGLVTPPVGFIEGVGGASGSLQITASAGVLVEGTGVGDTVKLEVSGGDGTRFGGDAGPGFSAIQIGSPVPTETDDTYEVVMRHARLVSDGGDATAGGAGGSGGLGGNLLIDAGNGRVEAFDDVMIQANGGDGARALFADGDVGPPLEGGEQPGIGASARTISVLGVEGVQLGDVEALGGAGENGNAGRGGALSATSDAGDVQVGDVTLNGGDATTNLADQVVLGGAGGTLTLRSGIPALPGEDPVPAGDVLLAGRILALGGSGVDADGDPTVASGGALTLRSNQAIEAVAPGASVEGGLVTLIAPTIGAPGAAIDIAGTAADDDRALLTVQRSTTVPQSLQVNLLPSHANAGPGNGSGLENVEVVHEDEQADSTLSSGGAMNPILQVDGAAVDGDAAVLASMKTASTDPHLAFTLDTIGDDTGAVPAPDLEIAVNAVGLGTAGGSITNDDGAIVAASGAMGTDSHVEARGNVVLDGTEIGALGEALRVDGAPEASLALLARGDVHVDAVDAAASGAFGAIDVTQSVATAETTIRSLDGAGAVAGDPLLDVNDVTVDPDAPIAELTADTSSSATDLAYRHTATGPGGGTAPVLRMQQVVLGGDGLFSGMGDLELTDTAATSIALMGEGSDLQLDAGGDLVIADVAPGVAHVVMNDGDPMDPDDDTADLVLDLGGSVVSPSGDAAFLVTENVERLAADFLGDDLRLRNQAGGGAGTEIEIAQIQWLDPKDTTGATVEDTFTGILGGDVDGGQGNVELDNGTRRIVLGDIPSVSPSAPPGHVGVFGDVVFHSPVEVENARYVVSPTVDDDTLSSELVAINDAGILAGGDVTFAERIDTGAGSTAVDDVTDPMDGTPLPDVFVAGTLRVDAVGTTTYEGDVGVASPLRRFETTDAVVAGASREVHAADVVFRGTLDGPAELTVVGEPTALAPDEAETRVTFAGDVGQASPLAALDAQADHIAFALAGAGSAERVDVAGDVLLDTLQPTVPQAATISDAEGDLRFRTGGDFRVGALDKLSVVGGLQIVSDGTVTVGDLSASSIEIVSPDIVVTTRPPGPVELADGSLLPGGDGGVDWVANRIVTSSAPETDDPMETLSLYLGSGGISIPGGLSAYRIRYASPDLDGVAGASLIGQDGRVLDLTGSGPPLVADPVRALPREDEVGALPQESPRFGSEDPAVRAEVSDREVLAFLRCSGFAPASGTDGCDAEDRAALASLDRIGDDALDTARAREITERYRELLATQGAIPRLRAAFAAAGRAYGESLEWRDGTLDGAAFYRFLATAPRSQARALASMRELAWLFAQIELLGLADEDTRRLQNTLAREFADAAGLQGLDADAVVAAVDASPIGLPRP